MSTVVRIALFQANTGIDPDKNAEALDRAADQASEGGAMMLFTPEMLLRKLSMLDFSILSVKL